MLKKKVSYKKTHGADKSGKSFGTATDFEFENGDSIRVICIDWDDEIINAVVLTCNGKIKLEKFL